ncbi:MAG: hypothetical protein MZW92_70980 [Comamonadaceae bacterium]|nr:hypothetical protein [Comamonadaceae bacterium]
MLLDDETGEITIAKCLTTPKDPSDAVEEGIRSLEQRVPEAVAGLGELIHGTTLVINAIIERKGAKTGLITTKGSGTCSSSGASCATTPTTFSRNTRAPLVPRALRLEVDERIRERRPRDPKPLDLDEVRGALSRAARAGGRVRWPSA